MATGKLTIFIAHPSALLTDCKPHGDGLISYSFIREIAAAGHTLHIASALSELNHPLPPNVTLYPIKTRAAQYPDERQSLQFRLEYAWKVKKLFKNLQQTIHFDIVHQLNPVVLGLSSLLYDQGAPLLLGPFWPSWQGEQTDFKTEFKRKLRDAFLRYVLKRSDGVLVPNQVSAGILRKLGIENEHILPLSIGIDTDAFYPDATRTPTIPTILFLAGLWKRKGIYTLLDAFELVGKQITNARLLIAGEGEEEAEVRIRIAQMKAGDRVSLVGRIPREQIRATMQTCSVYCLPSFGEPFGMSALEAMSCGRPLVVTNSGGLAELVPEEGGIKVSPGDSVALASALEKMLSSPDLAEKMGAFNRRHVLQNYSWPTVSSQLIHIYRRLAGQSDSVPVVGENTVEANLTVDGHPLEPTLEEVASVRPKSLRIFIPHCSSMLTNYMSHGDGQIAYGFLHRLAERGHEIYVATPRAELREPLHPNLHVHVIHTRAKGFIGRLEYMARMRRYFNQVRKSVDFDIMHQMNPVFPGISLAMSGVKLPLVLGTYVARWPDIASGAASKNLRNRVASFVRNVIDALQQSQADALLLTTPAALNRLPKQAHVRSKVHWIGHGVDSEMFSPDPNYLDDDRLQWEQENPSILFLANISTRKGINPLLHAFAQVLHELPACKLTVVGDGPQFADMKRLANDLGIAENVAFLGKQPNSAAPSLYRSHCVYCLPSLGEPYATSVLEAMSCGRPLVLTNGGGLPSMVPPDGAELVPMGEHQSLAEALISVLKSPEKRRTMAANNRRHILSNMCWPSMVDDLESVYASLTQSTFLMSAPLHSENMLHNMQPM